MGWVCFFSFREMKYCLLADIRELVSLDDVMEELGLGPNGGLMYCMEYPFPLHFIYLFMHLYLNIFHPFR